VAETHVKATPPNRQRRLRVAVVSLQLGLARRRGHLAGVIEQARFLATPVTGPSDEDIALGNDLRAVALYNLGTLEAWSLGSADAERHLQEGAALARQIGRPYLEVGCLAQLGFASRIGSFATTRQRCHQAIALAERHGWATEPIVAPALVTLAANLVWTGAFDEGERWLQRTAQALETDTGPGITQLLHLATGRLHAGRGRHDQALNELRAAEHLQSQLAGPHALTSQMTGCLVATQARLGQPDQARATLAALPPSKRPRASSATPPR
jgi:LuxR family maltose regulon positive regulatory protein